MNTRRPMICVCVIVSDIYFLTSSSLHLCIKHDGNNLSTFCVYPENIM